MPAIQGVYDDRPYNQSPKPYLGPNPSLAERLMQESLDANTSPGAVLSANTRPTLSQLQVFRPRYGYRTRQVSIEDIIETNRAGDAAKVSWWSGGPGGYSGTSRNSLGDT